MTIGNFSLGLCTYQQQGQKSQEEELKGALCTQHSKGMNRLFSYLFWHQSDTVKAIHSLQVFKSVLSTFHHIQPATVPSDV